MSPFKTTHSDPLTLTVSSDKASCCDPRNKYGNIFVGPTLADGRHGCDNDVRG